MGIAATVNGGLLIPPTFLKRSPRRRRRLAKQVLKPETSREDALSDAAQRREGHRHARPMSRAIISAARPAPPRRSSTAATPSTKLLTDFMAVLPADKPQYLLLIMLDEPQPTPETHGFRHRRLERRADRGQGDRARRAAARHRAALRPAEGRPADPGQGDREPVSASRSFPRKRESRAAIAASKLALGPRLRGDERMRANPP